MPLAPRLKGMTVFKICHRQQSLALGCLFDVFIAVVHEGCNAPSCVANQVNSPIRVKYSLGSRSVFGAHMKDKAWISVEHHLQRTLLLYSAGCL